jgi:DNA helicase-2/ATP-dependent DNA helicase PcrA
MKSAVWNNQTIHINRMTRDRYQEVFDAGVKGALSCSVCGEKVKLYLGLNSVPHFFHIDNSKSHNLSDSQDILTKPIDKPAEEFVERNGFRYPKARNISVAEEQKMDEWRSPRPLTRLPIFLKEHSKCHSNLNGFFLTLQEKNIFLDKAQQEAVSTVEGPLLVLAGAGSGKTRVLITRVAYMVQKRQIDPRSIMLITFTAKAANEMKERLRLYENAGSRSYSNLLAGTFHSIFYRILQHHNPSKWNGDNLLKWEIV